MRETIWKRSLHAVVLASTLVWSAFAPAGAGASALQPNPGSVSTGAEAYALIDVSSGRILSHKGGDKPMRIASLTKIMTAIVAIENGKLSDNVKVTRNAYGKEGSKIYVKLGEEMSLENMLYGLMLRSGNDAASAIAEHVGGSIDGFVFMMNEKAKELGLAHTQFRNPHGLDSNGHYSSADDLAVLTAYALKNPTFREIVSTKLHTAPNPNESWDYKWYNKNKMLTLYEGADGVKTGYTSLANRCLVSSATRGGQQLAVVTLNDRSDWADHMKLMDYGFQNYPLQTLVAQGDQIHGTAFVAGVTAAYPLLQEERGIVKSNILSEPTSSVEYGFGLRGRLVFTLDQKKIASIPLYEPGSPRLQANERAAFQPAKERSLGSSIMLVWKALVTVAGSSRA